MSNSNQQDKVVVLVCPVCHSQLWVDLKSVEIIKVEKGKKPKSSLDDLLAKEKEKKAKADLRFEATAKMAQEKKKKLEKEFKKFLETWGEDKD